MTGELRRVVLFIGLGGIAAAINWLSRFLFSEFMPFGLAVIAAYLAGMVVAFTLFRAFVFPFGGKPIGTQAFWFVVVNLLGIVQVWLVSISLVDFVFPWLGFAWHAEAIGHAIAIATPTVTSYFGHKHLTYRA